MSIYQRLQEDIKEAMKAHESEKLLALRTLNADIKKIHIDAGRREATDDDVVSAVTKAIKQRDDAATQMDAGGRPELAAVERSQAELFKAYQPAQLSAQELEAIVKAAIASTGAASAKATSSPILRSRQSLRLEGRANADCRQEAAEK